MKGNSKSNQAAVKAKPHLDPKDRDLGSMKDLEDAMRQLVESPPGKTKSENREPSREELKRRHKVVRR